MIIANMATFPARKATLESTVRLVASQVDRLNLCLNEYETIPRWTEDLPNVNAVIPSEDLKDLGKFMFEAADSDMVFLVDDDIRYPDDYVQTSLDRYSACRAALGHDFVGGYHGTIYTRVNFRRIAGDLLRGKGFSGPQLGRDKTLHPYHDKLATARIVSQLGTGTVICPGRLIPKLDDMIGAARRADVRFARLAHERRVPMVALPRTARWMPPSADDTPTIWSTYTETLPPEFVEEVARFAFEVEDRGRYVSKRQAA